MTEIPSKPTPHDSLRPIVEKLLAELTAGAGDKDKRRQVEEWLRNLADKFPAFQIPTGLRGYYLAEAGRLQSDFERSTDLTERLALARSIEGLLDKASEIDRRQAEK